MRLRFAFFSFLLLAAVVTVEANPCTAPLLTVGNIRFEGNDITKERILFYELNIATGDTVEAEQLDLLLEENRKRLYNLRLFHRVTYSYTCDEGQVDIVYAMQERWYFYPIPILYLADRNFNAWLERNDWSRVDYGVNLIRRNFRGRNEEVRLKVQRGFNKRLEFVYRVPNINRTHSLGLDFGVADYRSRAIDYMTTNNRQRFLVQEEGLPIRRTSVVGGLIQRKSVERQNGLRLSYHHEQVSDTVALLNSDYYRNAATERQYMRMELFKVVNLRDSFSYPLRGSYLEGIVGQTFFYNQAGTPLTTARIKYVNYVKLSDKLYYTVGAEGQLRLSRSYAYADNIALGFRAHVRGYELFVIGGQHYGLFKQGISRELLNLSGIRLKWIRSPKFNTVPLAIYANAFTDAGYAIDKVFDAKNPLANRLLYGGGLGLHIVTFYDIVLRAEYTVNREGSRGLYFGAGFPF